MMRIVRTIAGAGLAVALIAGGTVSLSLAADEAAVIKQRQNAMKANGKDVALVKAFVEKGQGSPAAVEKAAMEIASTAEKIPALFPKGTSEKDKVGMETKSRAKPEIWAKWSAFEKDADTLKARATALAEAAKTGDKDKIKTAFAALGKACGGCHKPFRGAKKKS